MKWTERQTEALFCAATCIGVAGLLRIAVDVSRMAFRT